MSATYKLKPPKTFQQRRLLYEQTITPLAPVCTHLAAAISDDSEFGINISTGTLSG